MILVSVVTTTRHEVEWVHAAMGRVFPEEWARFREIVPEAERDGDLSAAYSRLLHAADPLIREHAARAWCAWEDTHVATYAGHARSALRRSPLPHVLRPDRDALLEPRSIPRRWPAPAGRASSAGIPRCLIHGRLDISGPPDIGWQLHRLWPDAELVLVDDAGHGGGHPTTLQAILTATERFAIPP